MEPHDLVQKERYTLFSTAYQTVLYQDFELHLVEA